MQTETVPIDEPTPDPANARKHGERNLAAIIDSLKAFGQQKPIVVDKRGIVVAGNGTLEAAKRLGWNEIAVVRSELEPTQATAFGIADNRTAELAEWDDEVLRSLLDSMDDEMLDVLAFDSKEIDDLVPSLAVEVQEDEIPEEVESRTKPGELWILGRHRLLCGDSTNAEDVAMLMDGEKADLCFTSPPYGQQRDYGVAKELVQDWDGLMRGVFANLPMSDAGQVLVNLGLIHRDGEWIPYWDGWIEWMREQGWRRFGWYVWDKKSPLPMRDHGRLLPQHEWVFHFCRTSKDCNKTVPCLDVGSVQGYGLKNASGVRGSEAQAETGSHRVLGSIIAAAPTQGGKQDHPAVMSLGLPMYLLECWSGSVFDPFLGSGTTLIAAEQLDRQCFGMEIDPAYCDVIVRRWEKLTGETAVLADE